MPVIEKSVATLRIFGDNLVPEELTALLGVAPTSSYRKGDTHVTRSGSRVVRKTGMWRLEASDREPEDINAQVSELLDRATPDLDVWRGLSQKYDIDLFCGLFMDNTNEGFSLSPTALIALGLRGIEIGFDVYAPSREIVPSEPCPCGSGVPYQDCCAPKSNT
jgi:hypothetical protein